MTHTAADDEEEETDYGFVCEGCIGDNVLSAEISASGFKETCSYCGAQEGTCVTIEWLGGRVDDRYRDLIGFVELTPDFSGDDDRVSWVQDGQSPGEILTEMIEGADDKIADDILDYLGERHSYDIGVEGDTDWYDRGNEAYKISIPSSPQYKLAWREFCASLKHKRRFFSVDAISVLDEILGPILRGQNEALSSIVRTIGPESEDRFVFRGRSANDDSVRRAIYAEPIKQLGAPPPELAPAGRMNPHGISVFYGCRDAKTCVAELRAPVGGWVIVGKFEIIRPLRILDLTQLWQIQNDLSYFHDDFLRSHDYVRFIRGFHDEIRKSVIPGRELLEYLPTQVVAEYLWTRQEGAVDGVIFRSAQVSGDHANIVLFPAACSAEGVSEEQALDIESVGWYGQSDDEEYDNDCRQSVWLKPKADVPPPPPITPAEGEWENETAPVVVPALPSLRFHRESLTAISVQGIAYDILEAPVSYHQGWAKDDPNAPF